MQNKVSDIANHQAIANDLKYVTYSAVKSNRNFLITFNNHSYI